MRYKILTTLFMVSLLFVAPTFRSNAQPGQYAGTMKKLVGTVYKDSKLIAPLKGFEFREGSLISAIDDPEAITVDVFQKGTMAVVFFSIMQDSSSHEYTVMDVLEVPDVPKGWQVRTTFCRDQGIENVEIVALAKSEDEEFLKTVKQAWRFSRDKRKFLPLNPKTIDCRQEG